MNAKIQRKCPLCGKDDVSSFLQKKELALVCCKNCGMIFANPVPAEMSGEFYDNLGTPFYLSPEKLECDYASVRFEREWRLFRKFCPQGMILDVGCSTGAFLFQLKSRGNYQVTGTDISKPALDYARSRDLGIIGNSFPDHNFGEIRFDAITFWAVIEHLLEPEKFLRKAAMLLKSGGHCFILVPNLKSLAVRLLGAKYRYIFPQHLNYFTARTLKRFVLTEHFEIVASGSMHFNPIVIWQDFRSKGDFVPDDQRAALLKRTTAYKQNPVLKPVKIIYRLTENMLSRLNLSDNLFIVLRKK
ncbi:MAG TPA: methyltransferase domain-containing protein [Candidatus Paceibacterota bacterium]|nr:methyltransferase domain-containing protein [Candidatus Paceibacterota bacterium]